MNIGRLDRRITIQRKTTTRDANGGEVVTWSDWKTVWASKADQGSREFRSAGALYAETTTIFGIRYLAGVTGQDRIVYRETVYDIVGAPSEVVRLTEMLIQAKTEAVQP
jgi:SPP1 family predicted phage head-tail adaptor